MDHLQIICRIDFTILLLTFKALHGLAPSYISDVLVAYEPLCSLRSSGRGLVVVNEVRLKTRGEKGFAVRAPKYWNELA